MRVRKEVGESVPRARKSGETLSAQAANDDVIISLKILGSKWSLQLCTQFVVQKYRKGESSCVSFLLLQIKCRNHLKTTRICCLIVSEGLVWAQLSWILAQGLRGPRSRHGPCSGSPLKLGVIFQAHSVLLLNSAPCRIEVPVFLLSVSWGLCSAPGGHLFPVT